MKQKITFIIDNLIMYDYILFGGAFLLFIVFIILALVARKRIGVSVFLITIAFAIITIVPTIGYEQLHKYLFKNEINILSENKLIYSQAVIVDGVIKNSSEYDFKHCEITARVYKASENKLKNYIYSFLPFTTEKVIKEQILKDKSKNFTIIIEPFTYQGMFKIEVKGKCG